MKKTVLISLILCFATHIQAIESQYHITPESIMKHIEVLASDSLEGRQVGELGELKAGEYIRTVFKSAGLTSVGTDNYFQYYDFVKEMKITDKNSLNINGIQLVLHDEYIPLNQSASLNFKFNECVEVGYGIKISDDSGSYNDYRDKSVEGKVVFIKRFGPDSTSYPHIDFSKYSSLSDKINQAIKEKVGAIVFFTPEGYLDTLDETGKTNIYSKEIPIFFLKRNGLEKTDGNSNPTNIVEGNTDIEKIRDTAQNVIGFLQGESDTTVIIGAHYDHLGYGGPTSLYHGEPAIHNGADDNASGVAALLELARSYAQAKTQLHYSILFIAFSGEEAGLLGASKLANDMPIDTSKVRMMINMDMIGRLKDQEKGLAILGVGTTSEFKNFFDSLELKEMILTLKESGTGPSDQTIFYNRKIPVLHLFTGAHQDYHKPTDDIEKIDAEGIVKVASLVDTLVSYFDNYKNALIFTKTKDSSEGKQSKKYSVSLGVIPDYVAEVKGLQIEGVTEGRAAEKAGMLKGDIVIQLGENVINDIYDYMDALSKFKKGDTTKAIVNRDGKQIELSVTF